MQAEVGLSSRFVLLVAPLAGALITLSLAPFNIWPAGILSCFLYSYLLCTCTARQALWRGWLFGAGLFGTGVSWVYVSIHEHGNASMPLAIALTVVFCSALALLHTLFAWCYVRFVRSLPGGMLLGFPTLWVLFEWSRDWLLTGFPWLYLGYAHVGTWISGWAPVTGVFGLSFIVALTGSCLFLGWRSRQRTAYIVYTVVILILWLGGAVLKPTQWVAKAAKEPLQVAIVQPNVAQEDKWNPREYARIVSQLEEATEAQFERDLVVWPESAVPKYFQRAQRFLEPLAARAKQTETTIITGIPYRPNGSKDYYNGIAALGYGEGTYLKQRLVPFGEYIPLESTLRGAIDFFDLPMSSFSPGPDKQQSLRAGAFRVAPFICYEIVYGDLVAKNSRNTDIIVTISNDTWFGDSIGPLQHLQIAQMRGREVGRYVLRGTNNGVSAIIDHQGRIVAQSERFVSTTLVGEARVMLGETPFGSFGTTPIIAACATCLLLMVLMYVGFWRDLD